MVLSKIPPEQLTAGMEVAIAVPFKYGWSQYTGMTRYHIFTISKITPKRTKVICGANEYLVSRTIFYVPNEEMEGENRRINAFMHMLKYLSILGNITPTTFIDTAENMEKTVKLLEEIVVRGKKGQ